MRAPLIVLFTDVHNFVRVTHEFKDGNSLAFLDEMYQRLGDEIVNRGGRIIKYLGDAILATYDASREDAASQAIRTGFAIREAYDDLVSPLALRTETDLEVGISSGLCETGTVGHESLRGDDVFGEPVNEAAMIGHYRGVAVTAPVREAAASSADIVLERIDDVKLKWREDPLKVWAARPTE